MSEHSALRRARVILGAVFTEIAEESFDDYRLTTTWPPFLYVIHFDHKRHHAQHYMGASNNLFQRLKDHATGRAAKLTKALWEDSEEWELAAIYKPKPTVTTPIFDLETKAKRAHATITFCPLCNPLFYHAPPGTLRYPVPFSIRSNHLRTDTKNG